MVRGRKICKTKKKRLYEKEGKCLSDVTREKYRECSRHVSTESAVIVLLSYTLAARLTSAAFLWPHI